MQKNLKNFTFILTSTLLLSGCGGGGGGGSSASAAPTSSPSSSTTKTVASTTSTQSATPSTTLSVSRTGLLVDASGVEGLRVKCGYEESLSTKDGAFECSRFPMSVFIGEFKLGEVAQLPFDKTIYTQDLLNIARGATTHPEVTKISMLLQSLDSDAVSTNGLTISANSVALLNSHLSSHSKLEDISFEDLEYIIEDVVRESNEQDSNSNLQAFTQKDAQNNLTTRTAQTPALTYEQRAIGRIR